MKKICLFWIFALGIGYAAFAEKPVPQTDVWNVVFLRDNDSTTHTGVEFYKNGKKAFGIKFAHTHTIGFMVPLDDYKNGFCQTFIYKGIFREDEKSFNYKDYLIDLKGNGDKRYLLVTNWQFGNRGPYDYGYLIDTKDDFAIMGRVVTGEIVNYPMPNNELIFQYYDTLECFLGGGEANVFIEYKLQKGKMPLWIGRVGDIKNFSLTVYRKMLDDKEWSDARNYALAQLYCDLACEGLLKHFAKLARELGFSDNEIAEVNKHYSEKLRKSKLYKYLNELNGNIL